VCHQITDFNLMIEKLPLMLPSRWLSSGVPLCALPPPHTPPTPPCPRTWMTRLILRWRRQCSIDLLMTSRVRYREQLRAFYGSKLEQRASRTTTMRLKRTYARSAAAALTFGAEQMGYADGLLFVITDFSFLFARAGLRFQKSWLLSGIYSRLFDSLLI